MRTSPALPFSILLLILGSSPFFTTPRGAFADEALQTRAEKSEYRATSNHAEVMAFIEALRAKHPEVVTIGEFGRSSEGRTLPLFFVSSEPVTSPEQVRESGKLLVFLMGAIHGGEVCGKEALLHLARELAARPDHPLLEHLVLAIAPLYNADGNERIGLDTRPNQLGPALGAGERENAQNLDLNRDHVKLESPEARAQVAFLDRWDPAIIIDTHTTNGSYHRYPLTYAGPRHPATPPALISHVRDVLLPAVTKQLEEEKGLSTFFYGNFEEGHRRWSTYPDLPRYGTIYRGLRGRIGILSEAYAYATFRERVEATEHFVMAILEHAAENRDTLRELLANVDRELLESRNSGRRIALRSELVEAPESVIVKGFEEVREGGKSRSTGKPRDYRVKHVDRSRATLEVELPAFYVIPASLPNVLENLELHGLELEILREDLVVEVEVDRVTSIERAERAYQGHHLMSLEVERTSRREKIPAGSILLDTRQRLGTLAAILLESRSSDGLAAWNFLDAHLEVGTSYPVTRIREELPVLTTPRPEASEQTPVELTYENLYSGSRPLNLRGRPLRGLRWLPDGQHYLQTLEGRLWKVEPDTGRRELFLDPEKIQAALQTLPGIDAGMASRLARQAGSRLVPGQETIILEQSDDLFAVRRDGSEALRLTSTPGREELHELSPDGAFVAFVRENDLYVVDLATQTERRLTTGGEDRLRHGKNDWVYFEELYHRSWKAYWWSPDSAHLAFLRVDSRDVPDFTLVHGLTDPQTIEVNPYPKPGQTNPRVKFGVVHVTGGAPTYARLEAYDPANFLVSEVFWGPEGERAYFYGQNRIQTWLDLLAVRPGNETVKRLFRETTRAWVSPGARPLFLEDGTFITTSESSGWQHLVRYGSEGQKIEDLTSGEWEVRRVEGLSRDEKTLLFSGTRTSHLEERLYRLTLETRAIELLTPAPGNHSVNVSPDGTRFIDTWSTTAAPERVVLRDAEGELVRTLDLNPVPDLARVRLAPVEHHRIRTHDGFELEAQIIRPLDFDPGRRYPVWFSTYAGPQAPTVRNSWRSGRAWEQMLAREGIVQFRCDPRSASGKGAVSAWTAYRQLGVKELEDIREAIEWLRGLPYVDAERIGMSGHSYGGYITAYAMTHSKLFSAGISGAPVTDWHDYDTIYTERYMSTPADNPEGYRVTSAREAAANLHGRLLLVHGLRDDNVHPQNSIRFVQKLQEAGKDFELMVYPDARHGIWSRHYTRLRYDFIRRTMRPGRSF